MGNPFSERGPGVRVIASEDTWVEGEALRQLDETSKLPGMRVTVGMPDLHPGKGSPVGAAFLSEGVIYPSLVGTDIGCGMSLSRTDLALRKAKPERIAERLNGLDSPWDGSTAEWLAGYGLSTTDHDASLGTPGFGNHFIEVQQVHKVVDEVEFAAITGSADTDHAFVLVHSGSRGLGEAILRRITAVHGAAGLSVGTAEHAAYMADHDMAVRWAEANRDLCAHRVYEALRIEGTRCLDICHNSVTAAVLDGCDCWLHRKGAAPSDMGPVVIPGSRGDLTFLVKPNPQSVEALWSLAHGAGRKLARGEAKGKLRGLYRREDLRRNPWGGQVVVGDDNLAWEEAPDCYKDITSVVGDLEQAGLISVIASFHPLVTFKTSEGARTERRDPRDWKQDRRDARNAKHRRTGK